MLKKIIHVATKPKFLFHSKPEFAPAATTTPSELKSVSKPEPAAAALRIVHAGGIVEQYYMAIPAARIIDKYYPAFTLTRPDVFKRPCDDAVVRPEEILIPGQKYFVVPRRTLKKLKQRIRKSSSFSGKMENNFEQKNEFSISTSSTNKAIRNSGIVIKSKSKNRVRNFRVRFFGIDTCKHDLGSSSEHSINSAESTTEKGACRQNYARKRRAGNLLQWEPSLTSITENHDIDE